MCVCCWIRCSHSAWCSGSIWSRCENVEHGSWVYSFFFVGCYCSVVYFIIMDSYLSICFIWWKCWQFIFILSLCSLLSNTFISAVSETPLEVCSGQTNCLLINCSSTAYQTFKIFFTSVVRGIPLTSTVGGIFNCMTFDVGSCSCLLSWYVSQCNSFWSNFLSPLLLAIQHTCILKL